MLQKMTLTNFLSFQETTVFDFTPTRYGILNETNVSDNGVLKGALVIGPNASGKSNALRGIEFLLIVLKGEMKSFLKYWCVHSESTSYQAEYEFLIEGRKFYYLLRWDGLPKKELTEHLTMDGKDILTRKGTTGTLCLDENIITDDKLDPRTSYLRTASFATGRFPQHPELRALMEFIMNSYYVDDKSFNYRVTHDYAETHGVDGLNHYMKEFQYDFFLEYGSKSTGMGRDIDIGDRKAVFAKRKDHPFPMPMQAESQGNQTFVQLLTYLIEVIENPGMLVIDEFGNSLHNVLAEKIVHFFMKKTKRSQLFVTSHCTNLISNHVFRPDQIDLVTFDKEMGSVVKRISDYKPREAQNLEKMYLGGMFEGLPDYENV